MYIGVLHVAVYIVVAEGGLLTFLLGSHRAFGGLVLPMAAAFAIYFCKGHIMVGRWMRGSLQ